MKILVLSFYFPPDLSAGSFRTGALIDALAEQAGPDDSVQVLTTMPNRYASLRPEAPVHEARGNVTIDRIPLPEHKSGFVDQTVAFSCFAFGVLRRSRGMDADVVFATSSRLMTAALGALVAWRLRAKLHLDIRDLFTDTLANLSTGMKHVLLPICSLVERWSIYRADAISIVSPGFEQHLRAIRPDIKPVLRTNGVDREFLECSCDREPGDPPVILYAGNIGEGQGLEHIIPEAAKRLAGRYKFRIVGDGGRYRDLERALERSKLDDGSPLPVELVPPVDRKALKEIYATADILLLHLNDYPAFQRVLPSKLFEYGATGKPILAGVAGVSAEFVQSHLSNAAVFAPQDVEGLIHALETLSLERTDRSSFVARFSRDAIVTALARDLLSPGERQ